MTAGLRLVGACPIVVFQRENASPKNTLAKIVRLLIMRKSRL